MGSSMGPLWPWLLALFSLPGSIPGAPSPSRCLGVCSVHVPEDDALEGSPESQDEDIPAINQGLIPEESPEGSFLVEGDIIRPSPLRLLSVSSSKWPKSVGGVVEVPVLLSGKYDEPSRQVILEAFAEFERFTCIRFVAYQGHRDFISILPMSGCFSGVGHRGGMQVVSLAPACLQKGPGIVLHELMHVLGFWHEHARADRDRYIRVNWNEILPGFEINFIKSRNTNMLSPYDYSSVMHYGRFAFSWHGQPTIIPLWAPSVHIGQRRNLSASDVVRVRRLYNCNPSGPNSQGKASPAPSSDGSSTPASRSQLQRLLEALLESGSPGSSGSSAGRPGVTPGPVDSPQEWERPDWTEFSMEALASPPETSAASLGSRSRGRAAGVALGGSRPIQGPPAPLAPFPAARDQPAPLRAASGSPAQPGSCASGSHFREGPRD